MVSLPQGLEDFEACVILVYFAYVNLLTSLFLFSLYLFIFFTLHHMAEAG